MANEPVEHAIAAIDSALSDVDLRCIHCNYDLRGLSGDPVRCPECGLFTAHAEYAARKVKCKPAGRHASGASPLLYLAIFCLLLIVPSPAFFYGLFFAVLLLIGWAWTVAMVRRHAGGSSRWLALLLLQQGCELLALLSIQGLIVASVLMLFRIQEQLQSITPYSIELSVFTWIAAALLEIAAIWGIGRLAFRLWNKALACIDELDRCPPLCRRDDN